MTTDLLTRTLSDDERAQLERVFKCQASGLGREGGTEGMREYQDTKYLAVAT